jgi:AcrR family transcriptional regulator
MGPKHSREQILEAAMQVVAEVGLPGLTFGTVARSLGIPDRTVVYYFPNKDALVTDVLFTFGARLQLLLEGAFGAEPLPVEELLARGWSTLKTDEADAAFAVFFQVVGLAGAGEAPYRDLAPVLIESWVDWLSARVAGSRASTRRSGALNIIAQLDGLLLLRLTAGPDTADQAARALGIRDWPGARRARAST